MASSASAAPPVVWTYEWKPSAGEAPAVSIRPFKYDKVWAYAVEIDDGPVSTFEVSLPLLAKFAYTDAPPGLSGGASRRFVGGAAVFPLRIGTGNSTFLSVSQLRELRKQGWGVLNHGYRHIGNSWEPTGALERPAFLEELFWSQAVLAEETGDDRAPSHFVYPNGYVDYRPYLKAFGLNSASLVGGRSKNILANDFDPLDLDRNYLDESVWSKHPDPMSGLPADPKPGDLVIDFTHGMEADPSSANHRRWLDRLSRIARAHGREGKDDLWSASTSEIMAYVLASKSAKVRLERGRLTLELPGNFEPTALTVKLSGIDPKSLMNAPIGGSLHRKGTDAWLTTPLLKGRGDRLDLPRVRRIWEGAASDVVLKSPLKLAGIRLLQNGEPSKGSILKVELVDPNGVSEVFVEEKAEAHWGSWLLFAKLPNHPSKLTKEVRVRAGREMTRMEIWGEVEK